MNNIHLFFPLQQNQLKTILIDKIGEIGGISTFRQAQCKQAQCKIGKIDKIGRLIRLIKVKLKVNKKQIFSNL